MHLSNGQYLERQQKGYKSSRHQKVVAKSKYLATGNMKDPVEQLARSDTPTWSQVLTQLQVKTNTLYI